MTPLLHLHHVLRYLKIGPGRPFAKRHLFGNMKKTFLINTLLWVTLVSPQNLSAQDERLHHVTLKQAHTGTLEVDTLLLDSYGPPPGNIRQFYLQSRAILSEKKDRDFTHPEIIESAKKNGIALMGEPMLGDLGSDRVSIWLRPARRDLLTIKLGDEDGKVIRQFKSGSIEPGVAKRIIIDGLTPDTHYRYSILSDENILANGHFTTAPTPKEKGVMRLAFGADFHKIGLHNPKLFREISKREPRVMLLYGDSAVDGRKGMVNMHRADYLLRDSSQAWKKFVSHTPVYATWDDWDYFANDKSGVPKQYKHSDRKAVRAVWHENWNNPIRDKERKGIYFSTRLGPVEIFMLDTRSCRQNEKRGQHACYLGKAQQEWLKKGLKESNAPFKILSSGTMWSDYVSKAKDSWGSWDTKGREEIFSLIESEKVGGVLLLSGDRHGARGFKIPRPSGFAFHEFGVGTLGGVPGPPALVENCPQQLFGYEGEGTIAFGEFTFDTSRKDPTVTFRLISESGEHLEKHILPLSQLTPQ